MGWNRLVRVLALPIAWLVLPVMADRPVWAETRDGGDEVESEAPRKSADERSGEADDRREAREPKSADAPLVYIPPARGQAIHTVGAGTRTPTRGGPRVAALTPRDHVGWTSSARPRLYWYLSEATQGNITLTVVDGDAIEPLVETTLRGPVSAGVHALDLGALGVELEPGRVYHWFVMVVVHDSGQPARKEIAEGAIERVAVVGEADQGDARARARAGFWYDALEKIQDARSANSADPSPRADLEALLDQGQVEIDLP